MGKFYESKFYQYALLAFELMKLNVVAVVCSLPVVTIGAVWTGMYAAVSELSNDSGSTVKNFFAGFKKNFLRSTLHWLLLLLFFVLTAADLYVLNVTPDGQISKAAVIAPLIISFFAFLAGGFLFPLINIFKAPFMQTIRICVVFSVKYFLRSFFVLFLNLIPFILLYFNTSIFMSVIPLWVLIAFALIAYINCRVMRPVIDEINALLEEESNGE